MNTNEFDDMLGSDEEQEQTVLSPGAERVLNEDVIPTGAAAQVVSDDDDDDDDDDVAAAADEQPAPEAATVPKAVAVPPPSPPATDNGEGFIPGLPPVTTSTSSIASPVTYPSVTAEEDDGPGDPVVDDGKTKATAPSPTADAGAGVGAGAGAGAGASTGSEAKGSSDACCYGMCSCDNAYCNELWKWVTFKKPVPAIGIIVLSVTLFSLYSIAGVSLLRMASVVALLSMAVVPVLHAVNKFKHPAIVLPSIDISDKAFECIGKCVAKCCKAVLAHKKRVLSWEDPKLSTRALAYLWLLYMYNCLIGAPLLLALVFAVFIGPIAYKAARAPVGDLYRTKAKPALVQLDAKLHSISQKLKKVFADKKMRMAGIAGAVVLSLALWWVLKSTLGMWALFKFGATLGSLFTVGQHLLQRVRVPDTSAAKKTE